MKSQANPSAKLCSSKPSSHHNVPAPSVPLLDADLPRRLLMRLRDHHAQDSVLQARLDRILIHTPGEGEAAMEFPDRALTDPVLKALLLRLLLVLDDLGASACRGSGSISALVLYGRLMILVTLSRLSDLALLGTTFDSWRAARVLSLCAPLDDQGVVVGEFNRDVLLVDARELAV